MRFKSFFLSFFFLLVSVDGALAACPTVPPVQTDIETKRFYTDEQSSVASADIQDSNASEIANLNAFVDQISSEADAFAGHHDTAARVCALGALDRWASQGALLGRVTGHGPNDRMFAFSGISLALVKLQPPPNPHLIGWMKAVAQQVRSIPAGRIASGHENNLTYWGALAIGASAMTTGSQSDWRFAADIFHHAVAAIGDDGTLQNELSRGQRAAHYHEYAAQPLVTFARIASKRGEAPAAEEKTRLGRLVTLVVNLAGNSQALAPRASTFQRQIPMPGWLRLCRSVCGNEALAEVRGGRSPVYSHLGGDTTVLDQVLR